MWKDKKIIGAGILLVLTLFLLGFVFIKDKPKSLSQEEIEAMFVDVNTNGKSSTSKENEGNINKDNKEKNSLKETEKKDSNNSVVNEENNKENSKNNLIVVEIRGEVKKPDVYYIEEGKVVNDLINRAGGLKEEADISNINRAKQLNNHELVFINNKNNPQEINTEILNGAENSKNNTTNNNASQKKENSKDEKSSALVNINKASREELMTLPSIGEKTADKIIQYREENDGFKTIEDLKNVDRIGDKTLEKLKDKITI